MLGGQNFIEPDDLSFKYIFDRSSTASNRNRVGADEGETVGRIIADKGATVCRKNHSGANHRHGDNLQYNINDTLGIMTGASLGWPVFNVQRKMTGELAG
jgi:hypothetical protein